MRAIAVLAVIFLSKFCYADDAALQRLTVLLDPVKSLQANFEQTVSDAQDVVLQTSQGTIAVKRGNRLRWETTSPFAYLIVTDGSVMWRYDRDLEQATRQRFSGQLADTPALILSGETQRIKANYDVTREQGKAGEYFHLVPKQKDAMFRSLTLVFNNAGIAELILQDNLDQHTDIRFNSLVINPALADTLFHFDPPKGVDVVDDEP
ncbi:MAG TPA: outer membrane lipoprotein chaperone LolA [Spongiibacteraceae bacterium]|nr:outer membrane lipoprotein chaperone LolA [Spongiibacteraceae bacterium]